MIMDEINFCPTCGKNLSPGTAFCPACGSRPDDPKGEQREVSNDNAKNGERLKIAVILLLVTAAISIISGIVLYIYADSFMDWVIDFVPSASLTPEMISSLEATIRISAIMAIAGGVIAIISAYLAHKRRLYIVTIITCIIAAFVGNIIFGLIALYLIYKAKRAFVD
jgi:hypothetical protein